MSMTFTCDDKQTLVAYLYGEVDPAERETVEAHLAGCAACAAEVTALGDVRSELGLWAPPDAELGFAIVRNAVRNPVRNAVKRSDAPSAPVLRPARWWNTAPVWAQAAAAVLVLAAGAAIANVQVKSGPDGFSVTTGWMSPALSEPSAGEAGGRRVEGPAVEEWKTALVALEQQLRTEIRSGRAQATRVAAPATPDEATLRRVQQLLAASELRQQRELAMRFIEFSRDVNTQRRADLMKITSSFGEFDERILRQRQMMNNVIRVSSTPQQ